MKAGRELDAKIAGLMGWTSHTKKMSGEPVEFWVDEHENIVTCQEDWGPLSRWSPSEDEVHAGLVIDWLVNRGCMVSVGSGIPIENENGVIEENRKCRCHVVFLDGKNLTYFNIVEIADTRPVAICQAALMAGERWGE